MSSSKERYNYTESNKNSWLPLSVRRFLHRHPLTFVYATPVIVGLIMFHPSIGYLFKRYSMSEEEFKEYEKDEKEKWFNRVKYGEGVRLPFMKTEFNILTDNEVRAYKAMQEKKRNKEDKKIAELSPPKRLKELPSESE